MEKKVGDHGVFEDGHIASFSGKPVKMDTIIASTDPVAADATGGRVIGINPETIKHIKWLHEAGIGEIEDIQVVGDGIAKVLHVWNRE